MPVILGPLFSLSASGLFGKALLFYDTKYGARVRSPKKRFVPPGSIWEVNIEWFKKASIRASSLTFCQKEAWKIFSAALCDTWRDIFMGVQISYWNLHPTNDITWPITGVGDVGDITFYHGIVFLTDVVWYVDEIDILKREKWTCCYIWANILDSDREPVESDIIKSTTSSQNKFIFVPGHKNYLWGGVRYINGDCKFVFLDSYDK